MQNLYFHSSEISPYETFPANMAQLNALDKVRTKH